MKLSTVLACVVATLLIDVATSGLLRVPKVYNALITTNEKLVPSRAIPISAPLLHPIGSAPLLHPIGLAPAVPAVLVTSPYIAITDEDVKANKTDAKPEVPGDQKPEDELNSTSELIPEITPFSLPLAYYNSITYYHNVWPYSYSSVSPATFLFTAPFTYPGIFGDIYGTLPWSPVRKPVSDPASPKKPDSSSPEESKDNSDKESVSVEADS